MCWVRGIWRRESPPRAGCFWAWRAMIATDRQSDRRFATARQASSAETNSTCRPATEPRVHAHCRRVVWGRCVEPRVGEQRRETQNDGGIARRNVAEDDRNDRRDDDFDGRVARVEVEADEHAGSGRALVRCHRLDEPVERSGHDLALHRCDVERSGGAFGHRDDDEGKNQPPAQSR